MAKYDHWSDELERDLAAPFPAEWIKTKKAGKGENSASISFVPWYRYVSKLNALVGSGWIMGTPLTEHIEGKLCMGLPITIFGVTRVNWGDEDDSEWEEVVNRQTGETEEKKTMYGSPITNSYAQAFKRTCALFGMGLDLYDKGGRGAQSAPQKAPDAPRTARDAFSLDTVAGSPTSKAKGRTWRQLLETDEGRGYVKWALEKQTTMAPNARAALTEALKGQKADAVSSVLLQDAVNRAANAGAINEDQAARIEESIQKGESDEMRVALDWLKDQMAKLEGTA